MTSLPVPPDFLNIEYDRIPNVGEIIHVHGYDKCRAALVTGLSDDGALFVAIFSPNLPMQNAVVRSWHGSDLCNL